MEKKGIQYNFFFFTFNSNISSLLFVRNKLFLSSHTLEALSNALKSVSVVFLYSCAPSSADFNNIFCVLFFGKKILALPRSEKLKVEVIREQRDYWNHFWTFFFYLWWHRTQFFLQFNEVNIALTTFPVSFVSETQETITNIMQSSLEPLSAL